MSTSTESVVLRKPLLSRWWVWLLGALLSIGLLMGLVALIWPAWSYELFVLAKANTDAQLGWFLLAGFVAQMVDGSLGMGYGIICNSVLLTTGLGPAAASASVHFTKVFTSGFSGFSHLGLRNVNKRLMWHLVIPGVLGAVVGVLLLTSVDPRYVKPLVSLYLLVMGIVLVRKVWQGPIKRRGIKGLGFIGLAGGFLDAIGGGGWGPVVTTSLLNRGRDPRYTVGTVSLAEFFVAVASTAAFFLAIHLTHWKPIVGLLLGGIVAAPLAAVLSTRLPRRWLLFTVGVLIILLSIKGIWNAAAGLL